MSVYLGYTNTSLSFQKSYVDQLTQLLGMFCDQTSNGCEHEEKPVTSEDAAAEPMNADPAAHDEWESTGNAPDQQSILCAQSDDTG